MLSRIIFNYLLYKLTFIFFFVYLFGGSINECRLIQRRRKFIIWICWLLRVILRLFRRLNLEFEILAYSVLHLLLDSIDDGHLLGCDVFAACWLLRNRIWTGLWGFGFVTGALAKEVLQIPLILGNVHIFPGFSSLIWDVAAWINLHLLSAVIGSQSITLSGYWIKVSLANLLCRFFIYFFT